MRAARTSVVWLVDGHNVLLNVPDMERAHARDALAARTALAERCERFGMRRRIRVVVVFDGCAGVSGGECRRTNLEVVYAAGEGKADARIVSRAERAMRAGKQVTVVTDDGGIRRSLPRGAATHGTAVFWRLSTPGTAGDTGRSRRGSEPRRNRCESKPTVTDPDIAEHFLAREKETLDTLPSRKGRRRPRGK